MTSLDIWMRENPLTYVWLGSYAVAFIIFVVEVYLVRKKRRDTLNRIKMIREAGGEQE